MLARHEFAACAASPVTLDVVLTERSHWEADLEIPEWSEDLIRPMSAAWAQETSTLDDLLESMAGAGHGVAALSFYLGLPEADVRQRAAWRGIAQPGEKALRRSTSANPWSVADVRLLIALWLDNVAPTSIAAALGRSPSGVHGKRRWLGLGVRDRKGLSERSVVECRATPLPWTPSLDVSAIEACLRRPKPGLGVIAKIDPLVQFPVEIKWALGRHKEMDERFSVLGFAGLRAPAIARRMLVEFGVRLTELAVNNRISRLQIVRDRRDLSSEYDAEAVLRRSAEAMKRLGATMRTCSELNRSFWYCKAIGGNLWTCREFHTKKFQEKKAARSCGDVMAMA